METTTITIKGPVITGKPKRRRAQLPSCSGNFYRQFNVDDTSLEKIHEAVTLITETLGVTGNTSSVVRAAVRFYKNHLAAVQRKLSKMDDGAAKDALLDVERGRVYAANQAGAKLK